MGGALLCRQHSGLRANPHALLGGPGLRRSDLRLVVLRELPLGLCLPAPDGKKKPADGKGSEPQTHPKNLNGVGGWLVWGEVGPRRSDLDFLLEVNGMGECR